jgi:cytosine/adenosine deaminase-related metal-dependent hydrolase
MLRIGLSPCSPFTVTNELMKASAALARQYDGVRLHTHLAENQVRLPNVLYILLKFILRSVNNCFCQQ